jgi:hypothetical protein
LDDALPVSESPAVLSLESRRWSVGASEDEVWVGLLVVLPVLAVELVLPLLSLEGLLCRVGRSGSETGSVSGSVFWA